MSFVRISSTEAQELATHYQNVVSDASFTSSLHQLFEWGPETGTKHYLAGFNIEVDDFAHLVSYVGATHFQATFGLERATFDAQDRPRFTILLQAINESGSIASHTFKLTTPIPAPVELNTSASSDGPNMFSVPEMLVKQWTTNWTHMVDATEQLVPPYFLMIDWHLDGRRISSVLNGYRFSHSDFVSTLYDFLPASKSETGEDGKLPITSVCMLLANHHHERTTKEAASGLIGLLVCGGQLTNLVTGGEETAIIDVANAFFDFSSPCPPTCPGNAS